MKREGARNSGSEKKYGRDQKSDTRDVSGRTACPDPILSTRSDVPRVVGFGCNGSSAASE
jgi:hypothetical protein